MFVFHNLFIVFDFKVNIFFRKSTLFSRLNRAVGCQKLSPTHCYWSDFAFYLQI
ncbi:hypothetical protein M23134_06719 [Microscilla marina ATCC 23134]|uniref:Uncharacterized protein n=1 Tax=Microscilla marina ATCC 23134 TaxID=313606 RepID=A1ZXQ0_MICM2|nr:hypothetical protein M23134_06719 [Microscilla marina ATCC 23134]